MLTSKQRAMLRGLASKEQDVAIIGKEGLTQSVIDSIEQVLNARELIKIKVLQTCELSPRGVADIIEKDIKAEVAGVVGTKVIVYRKSNKKGVKHIEI